MNRQDPWKQTDDHRNDWRRDERDRDRQSYLQRGRSSNAPRYDDYREDRSNSPRWDADDYERQSQNRWYGDYEDWGREDTGRHWRSDEGHAGSGQYSSSEFPRFRGITRRRESSGQDWERGYGGPSVGWSHGGPETGRGYHGGYRGDQYASQYAGGRYGGEGRHGQYGSQDGGQDGQYGKYGSEGSNRGRGPKGYTRSGDRLKEIVCERLTDDPDIDASDISVEVAGQVVTLNGTVGSRPIKYRVEEVIESCGASDVINNLRVDRQQDYGQQQGYGQPQSYGERTGSQTGTGSASCGGQSSGAQSAQMTSGQQGQVSGGQSGSQTGSPTTSGSTTGRDKTGRTN